MAHYHGNPDLYRKLSHVCRNFQIVSKKISLSISYLDYVWCMFIRGYSFKYYNWICLLLLLLLRTMLCQIYIMTLKFPFLVVKSKLHCLHSKKKWSNLLKGIETQHSTIPIHKEVFRDEYDYWSKIQGSIS